jgi:O-antigen ligase
VLGKRLVCEVRLRPHKMDLLFPLTLMAFVGPVVTYANILFNTSTRWGVLALLVGSLIVQGRFLFGLRQSIPGFWIGLYLFWCVATTLWSEVPDLSLYKSIALFFIAVSLLSAGRFWVNVKGIDQTLSYLLPILFFVFVAGIAGQWAEGSRDAVGRGVVLYRGLTGNPNMFGSMISMTIPLLIWKLYASWNRPRYRLLWVGGLFLAIVFLLMSHSRAAMLTVIFASSGLMLALNLKKQLAFLLGVTLLIIGTLSLKPDLINYVEKHYIYKSGTAERGVLYSRKNVWKESYELAQQGGLIGGGYGVTIGETGFAGGLTAVGYGREKGNSQLAIWEETGIIGLFLYFTIIVVLFSKLLLSYRRSRDLKLRIHIAIILGMQSGLFVQSLFEAWWVAPGAPEAVYFWALTGISIGLLDKVRKERLSNAISRSPTKF